MGDRVQVREKARQWRVHDDGAQRGIGVALIPLLTGHDLVEAICAGNAAAAEETARRHVRIDLEMMEAALRKLVKPGE